MRGLQREHPLQVFERSNSALSVLGLTIKPLVREGLSCGGDIGTSLQHLQTLHAERCQGNRQQKPPKP